MKFLVFLLFSFVFCGGVDVLMMRTKRQHRKTQNSNGTDRSNNNNNLRNRVANRIMRHREKTTARVCYDIVGCFDVPHARSPLQKAPEAPEMIGTNFYLFRRNLEVDEPEVLKYEDNGTSLAGSKFNPEQSVRIYIHGYMSSWREKNVFAVAEAYLKLEDHNFILMDWSKGARGPQYTVAAANTEIAGRQLGILLQNMIKKGLNAKHVHLIGFSLGAHVAGCAAEVIKNDGKLLGRITGLDAAGPLFRHNLLKEKSKKLDKSDARFVDVLHTDSSPVFVDGFGLWEPIGHVDYFANGGQEQPGCIDPHASVLKTSFEKTLTRDTACSHIRANALFFESLRNKISGNPCEFLSYRCPGGLESFQKGQCFPQIRGIGDLGFDTKFYSDLGVMGQFSKGDGVMFFTTRESPPYCGSQIQATVTLSAKTKPTKGVLFLHLQYGNDTASFTMQCDITEQKLRTPIQGLSATRYKSLENGLENIAAGVSFFGLEFQDHHNNTVSFEKSVLIDKIEVKDMYSRSWSYCKRNTLISEKLNPNPIKLSRKQCN